MHVMPYPERSYEAMTSTAAHSLRSMLIIGAAMGVMEKDEV